MCQVATGMRCTGKQNVLVIYKDFIKKGEKKKGMWPNCMEKPMDFFPPMYYLLQNDPLHPSV